MNAKNKYKEIEKTAKRIIRKLALSTKNQEYIEQTLFRMVSRINYPKITQKELRQKQSKFKDIADLM